MSTAFSKIVTLLALTAAFPTASAQTFNPSNGHWYEVVVSPAPLTWSEAHLMATSATFMDTPGHLATIQDQAEDNFVDGLTPLRHWIGGLQDPTDVNFSEPSGGWKWSTGEPMNFTNWHPGEPNNSGGIEHHLVMHQAIFNGTWNDEGQTPILVYVIEYEPTLTYCTPSVANSTGRSASIVPTGSRLIYLNDLNISVVDLPQYSFGYLLNSMNFGHVSNPGGAQGHLCLAGAIGRYTSSIFNSGTQGAAMIPIDLTSTPTPTGSIAITVGQTWYFQAWFRDLNPGPTSNFTDAVALTFD